MSTFWLLFAVYIIGAIVIGVPMGIGSLRAWTDPHKHRELSFLLFPTYTLDDATGVRWKASQWGMLVNMVSEHELSCAFYSEDVAEKLACARYVVANAIIWPIRLAYLLMIHVFIGVVFGLLYICLGCNYLLDLAGKLLLWCKYCVRL
ncbi:MAG: hypothetical protein A3D65_02490 [Candidatus Lloydbacteria bacterium RIFCSPHIGHO2_02_FULL_50_13]|uniref:Uncharacterized protein n=1 Tax=Candidatus Lloydbacteria bacterium RIFCSPHIGHO2_02_FULL_50_13 TaxID=1798661 RepID=A0A1G2D5M2_9BACT|nr:MAG: hypothetical protein A3D65_02490 [Candidatus Lloydbacteria bacterium RIFCSPHIGHO2_02_FULL_50_13]